jgi:hypothetical protein
MSNKNSPYEYSFWESLFAKYTKKERRYFSFAKKGFFILRKIIYWPTLFFNLVHKRNQMKLSKQKTPSLKDLIQNLISPPKSTEKEMKLEDLGKQKKI